MSPPVVTEPDCQTELLKQLITEVKKQGRLILSWKSYTQAIRALDELYRQPMQLALKDLRAIPNMPELHPGDGQALDQFSLRVQALVGLLQSMSCDALSELTCGSHVEII